MGHGETALPVTLDRDSGVPLAVQLADALREAASGGHLRGGDRLPSTRALAASLGVSRTVTSAAYEQLHAEGWIVGRHGSGTYVTTSPPAPVSRRPVVMGPDHVSSPDLVALLPGMPWAEGIDRAAWRRAWRAAADTPPSAVAERAGLVAYRAAIAEHLLRHRGLDVAPNSVLATAGTTAAVVELAAALLRPGDLVAVEEPGYQRAVEAFRRAGVRVVPVEVDSEGLRPDTIPDGVRVVYCSPAHQYPLGGRLSAARRVELVDRARTDGFLVVEDDYDGELRYDVAPLPLLAALAPDVVVHLGTTSKILTPTLGVGWMVAPPGVTAAVLAYREDAGTRASPAGQQVFVELARHGDLGRHLRRLRRELSERRSGLVTALREADVPVLGDDAGAHLVVPLESADEERRRLALARERGLLLDGLARHFAGIPTSAGIAVGYAGCSRETLQDVLGVLVDVLRLTRR
ncbi:transcriptional regulator with HTH domain and aminotransferase domain [Saccharomonospora glauca K62]|uniref:Transcriptional regulator with HTH domain and aminotransferase domain n=1 Tax=Saccharomonospora glauca K62 TaxID=928724 RepID=I1CZ04_9PSEU|nr:transcriptional regulator with HTH domain and aminotransferase domain [Saccharomonospora glauca K62]